MADEERTFHNIRSWISERPGTLKVRPGYALMRHPGLSEWLAFGLPLATAAGGIALVFLWFNATQWVALLGAVPGAVLMLILPRFCSERAEVTLAEHRATPQRQGLYPDERTMKQVWLDVLSRQYGVPEAEVLRAFKADISDDEVAALEKELEGALGANCSKAMQSIQERLGATDECTAVWFERRRGKSDGPPLHAEFASAADAKAALALFLSPLAERSAEDEPAKN